MSIDKGPGAIRGLLCLQAFKVVHGGRRHGNNPNQFPTVRSECLQFLCVDQITVQTYDVSEIIIEAELAQAGLVVLSDVYFPGWKAYVDGVEQPIYPTNLAMRGVYVDRGSHLVRFVYQPQSFRIGVLVSLATVGLSFIGLIFSLIYSRNSTRNSPIHFINENNDEKL